MELVEGESQVGMGVSRLREAGCDLLQIGDRHIHVARVPLDESAVVEGTRVSWSKRKRLFEVWSGVVVPLPLDLDDGEVGVGVGIVRTKLGDACEGSGGGGILLGVEQGDCTAVSRH